MKILNLLIYWALSNSVIHIDRYAHFLYMIEGHLGEKIET